MQSTDILKFYQAIGVDEATTDTPINHQEEAQKQKRKRAIPVAPSPSGPASTIPEKKLMALKSSFPLLMSQEDAIQSARQAASQAQTLEELKEALETYPGCPLKLTATQTVFGAGNPASSVMLVGEAPGADEDRQGVPFVGLSGQLLDRMLEAIGLDRTSVYISNIVPWRPPGNRVPSTTEIALCHPFIERHIELVNPKFLMMIGGTATKALLNTTLGIMKVRGQWMPYQSRGLTDPIQALATYHPAYLLRSPGQKREAWLDFLTLKQALKHA